MSEPRKRKLQKRERPTVIGRSTHKHAIKLPKPSKRGIMRLHAFGLLSDALTKEFFATRNWRSA